MEELLQWMEYIEDTRQAGKVRHLLKDILVIVLFATLANADDWVEISLFASHNQTFLRKYIALENGIPSHDTIQRVMGMIAPEVLQSLYAKWQELLNRNEGQILKKIICIDGKTMRGNTKNGKKPTHVVSAWSKEDGFCLGQKAVQEKSNEITAIPDLLKKLQIKGQIVTIDAMGTQKEITKGIRDKRADYVLAVKGNQMGLYEDLKEYFADEEFLKRIEAERGYKKQVEKAHSQIETREYYQTMDIQWLPCKKEWRGLKSIAMERTTIRKGDQTQVSVRYYISSMPLDIEAVSRAIRGHWSVESMHWHLDVTFREDANRTIDRTSAQNLNIIRKWCLSILKITTLTFSVKRLSMRKKRFVIGMSPITFLEDVLAQ